MTTGEADAQPLAPRPAAVPARGVLRARTRTSFALWVGLYTLVAILPLPLGLIQLDPGRGFWINFSVALGFVGLSMFGLQFVMGARSYAVAHPVGMDLVLKFHREMAYLATLLVFAHPIILFVVDTRFLGLLDVFTSPLRAKFAVSSWVLLLSLIALSVFRRRLRIRYETWQLTDVAAHPRDSRRARCGYRAAARAARRLLRARALGAGALDRSQRGLHRARRVGAHHQTARTPTPPVGD